MNVLVLTQRSSYGHSFIPILVASYPVHWTIRCDGWRDLVYEVRQDQYLDEQSKSDLIDYFKTKVEEDCNFEP